MLDTIFKNGSGRKQSQDELRDLVTQAREEREALELMLARVKSEGDARVLEARDNAAALHALAEHVSHKTKALEAQKHTVERAVVEATRLNEMVWNMDAQIARLAQ